MTKPVSNIPTAGKARARADVRNTLIFAPLVDYNGVRFTSSKQSLTHTSLTHNVRHYSLERVKLLFPKAKFLRIWINYGGMDAHAKDIK